MHILADWARPTETGLAGWAERIRTRKCRFAKTIGELSWIKERFRYQRLFAGSHRVNLSPCSEKEQSWPWAKLRDDALDGETCRPCKHPRNQRERPCPTELPGPAALESVRRARIITAPGTMVRRIPTLFRNGFDVRLRWSRFGCPARLRHGGRCVTEPRDFRGIPGRAIARRETASLNLISRAWRPSSAVPAPAELPSE